MRVRFWYSMGRMNWLAVMQYFGLGTIGGVLVDGMELVNAIRSAHGRVPRIYTRWGYWLSEAVRLAIGGTLTAIMYASHQVDTPMTAVTIGVAAPIIIERLTKAPPPGSPEG